MRTSVTALAAFSVICACGFDVDKQPAKHAPTVSDVDDGAANQTTSTAATTDSVPDVRCEVEESEERLTRDEMKAIRSGDSKFNPLVAELVERMVPKEPPALPDTTTEQEIDWEQAKRMVWNGLVTTTIQGHDRSVVLITSSGRSYRTIEPRLDEIWRVAALIDPCHRYITHITE
jgi:hypothetical protein